MMKPDRVRFRNRIASIRGHLDVALSLLSSTEQNRDYVGLSAAYLADVAWRAFRAAVEAEGLREFLLDEEIRSRRQGDERLNDGDA